MAVKFWVGQKEENAIPLPSALCFIWLYHAAHCRPTIGGYQDLSICPNRPVLSHLNTLSEKETSATFNMLMSG